MLLIIVILLSLNILLNLTIGLFLLGELGTLKKYRFEFGPVLSSSSTTLSDLDADVPRSAI